MILVTAFEPFGGKTWNASKMILDRLNLDVDKLELPVSINSVKEVIENLDLNRYEFILMLGEANRDVLSLEQYAYNELDMRIPDNEGIQILKQTIDEGETFKTPIDLSRLLKPGMTQSIDPGRYLCNYVYYHMGKKHPNVLFVHVSATKETVESQTQLIEEIIHEIKTLSIAR
jgi:pyrrolidone-carboxylate peptidase